VREAEAARDWARLGPDIVAEAFAPDDAVGGLRALGGARAIGEALLEQRALAGIGNIYKSEALFAEKVSPFARIADLDDATLGALVGRARVLMRRNLAPAESRTTTSGLASSRYAVYRRSKRPCPRCGTPIVRVVQGRDSRSTYYCPRCQPGSAPG
jgi:endonuclease-8